MISIRSTPIFRLLSLILLLGVGAIGCSETQIPNVTLSSPPAEIRSQNPSERASPSMTLGANSNNPAQKLADGDYPVQQATYDDTNGDYTLMLLDAPIATYRTSQLQMARLTDEQLKTGQKSYLKITDQSPVFYLTEDFKINYVHNIVEARPNPTTGRSENVVIRQESNVWSPFLGSLAGNIAGNIAGQAIGGLIFRPQHYMPPQYQPGINLIGFGGYGQRYDDAVGNYRQRYNEAPIVERNRTTFRSNGSINRQTPAIPAAASSQTRNSRTRSTQTRDPQVSKPRRTQRLATPPDMTRRDRSTGSGFGSSDLRTRQSTRRSPDRTRSVPSRSRSNSSFGSGRSATRSSRSSRGR